MHDFYRDCSHVYTHRAQLTHKYFSINDLLLPWDEQRVSSPMKAAEHVHYYYKTIT